MATQNLSTCIEPWAWVSDKFLNENDKLTKALTKSISSYSDSDLDSLFTFREPETSPTVSTEPETAPKRQRNAIPAAKKVSKRKSRASKLSQTTFITADPANFRQMVQQVTGVRFLNSPYPAPILKPEPVRLGGGFLPTLDTSAFLLDHHHQHNVMVGPGVNGPRSNVGPGPGLMGFQAGGGNAVNVSVPLEFDSFCNFPTLESGIIESYVMI
ncbi:hypothetical protein ACFE04_030176 [Oxalis oulophora]